MKKGKVQGCCHKNEHKQGHVGLRYCHIQSWDDFSHPMVTFFPVYPLVSRDIPGMSHQSLYLWIYPLYLVTRDTRDVPSMSSYTSTSNPLILSIPGYQGCLQYVPPHQYNQSLNIQYSTIPEMSLVCPPHKYPQFLSTSYSRIPGMSQICPPK